MAEQTVNIEINSEDDAISVAKEVERLEAVLKEHKNVLKQYVDENGPLATDEKVWDYHPTESWNFHNMKGLAEMIALEGYNPWEMFSLSKKELKKLGFEESFLQKYGEKVTNTQFRALKASGS